MIRRILAAIAVLSGTIYWAHCGFPGTVVTGEEYFVGCFSGPVNEPAVFGNVTIILSDPEDTEDMKGTIGGCFRVEGSAGSAYNGMLAGALVDSGDEEVTVAVTSSTPFSLRVVRQPSGTVDAVALTLNNASNSPFVQAANLPRCSTNESCPAARILMPFTPGGGTP